MHNKKCEICGKLYVTKVIRSKYCSKKCLGLAHNKRAKERMQKGICGYCHKEFLYSGDHQRKYCTTKCFALALAEQGKEEVNINGVSWAFGTFILTLRETDPEAYHKIHVKLYHEMGPESRMRFDRNLSKFQIKIRGKTFLTGEKRKCDGSRYAGDQLHEEQKETVICIPKEEPNPIAIKVLNMIANRTQYF